MDVYVDTSVKNFTGDYTRKARGFDVKVQILLKVPVWDLTTVRVSGSLFNITEFLRAMNSGPNAILSSSAVLELVKSAKPVVEEAPHWKNRALMENRNVR